jgi:hypothetical protein
VAVHWLNSTFISMVSTYWWTTFDTTDCFQHHPRQWRPFLHLCSWLVNMLPKTLVTWRMHSRSFYMTSLTDLAILCWHNVKSSTRRTDVFLTKRDSLYCSIKVWFMFEASNNSYLY